MQKLISYIVTMVAWLKGRKSVVRAATLLTAVSVPVFAGGVANATGPTDPLNGAGQGLVDDLLTNFTTYVIPAVAGVILAVYAFKMIVKLGTRFLNRA